MSSYEYRPEVYGDGVTYGSPALMKMMGMLREGDLEHLLTDEHFDDFFDRLASIDLDGSCFEDPQKIFLQVYFKDPSKEQLEEYDSAWIGCEYDMWADSEDEICFIFRGLMIPAASRDPIYDPDLQEHFHMVISDEEINWEGLLPNK